MNLKSFLILTLLVSLPVLSRAQRGNASPPSYDDRPGFPGMAPPPGSSPEEAPPGPPRGRGTGDRRQPGPPGSRGDSFMQHLFAPETVMRNQKALGLSDDQSSAIRAEVSAAVAQLADSEWQQSREEEALSSILRQEKVDEAQALAHLNALMKVETDIKRTRMRLLLRIRNQLTPEQQEKLRQLPRSGDAPRGDRPPVERGEAHPPAGGRERPAPPLPGTTSLPPEF